MQYEFQGCHIATNAIFCDENPAYAALLGKTGSISSSVGL